LQMIIHGFVFKEDTKPDDEHHLQTTPTLLQASLLLTDKASCGRFCDPT
jgi:hypothetical protein